MMDRSVDTDIASQQRTGREQELQGWDEDRAREIAAAEGVELTDEHFKVIHKLRDYYRDNGLTETGSELGDMLDEAFSEQGGRKYLHTLFPEGPVAQGMRIAGLPVPAHTENESFGTAR
jgi:TusE/DsrC/DsvC family sulfur relay protein